MVSMATISVHLDNDHVVLNSTNNRLSGIVTIRNWKRPSCALKQPRVRLLGEAYIAGGCNRINVVDGFLDESHQLIFNDDNTTNSDSSSNSTACSSSSSTFNIPDSITSSTSSPAYIVENEENTNDNNNIVLLPFSIPVHDDLPVSLSTAQHWIRYTIYAIAWNGHTEVYAVRPVFFHRRNEHLMTTKRLYWGTSKTSRQWRYEISLPRAVTTSAIEQNGVPVSNEQQGSNDDDITASKHQQPENSSCVISATIRIKNTHFSKHQHHHLPRQQQQFETSTKPKRPERCLAEFEFVEECRTTITTYSSPTRSSYCAKTSSSMSTLLSETHTLSCPSYTWNCPWKVGLKLDLRPLPTTTLLHNKNYNHCIDSNNGSFIASANTTTTSNTSYGISIRHYLQIKLKFDDGNGHLDHNIHTFPLDAVVDANKVSESAGATTKTKTIYRDPTTSATSSSATLNSQSTSSVDTSSTCTFTESTPTIANTSGGCSDHIDGCDSNNNNSDSATCPNYYIPSSSSDVEPLISTTVRLPMIK
ncbi:hypothetical protein BDB00DRAFT_932098 [Zychaea mexicana]|uniref:uncharacterized protein n=1 Tax=Zychaea mexicana TaxID=64656 RepID=UPI0022FE7C14|nr:uncharacterized protein BDB00DRAFT_932098 [Zychaea mexicana]KAI9489331.1 hypothetical protein BDB00DRAFT_932098 [Zychaea mexicana]